MLRFLDVIYAEDGSRAMFVINQPNLLSNKRWKSILSSHIFTKDNGSVNFHWAPFPIEMNGVSAMVPSPSGSKLLVVKNSEGDSPIPFEIWGSSEVKEEFSIPRSVHGPVYSDGWYICLIILLEMLSLSMFKQFCHIFGWQV